LKRSAIVIASFVILFALSIFPQTIGWMEKRAHADQTVEILPASDIHWQWRPGQPTHWRALLLQR
jgi:hypothetical protein